MNIEWNKVTRFSQIVAVLLFVVVFFVGYWIGQKKENRFVLGKSINDVKFVCADNKDIEAVFYKNFVYLKIDKWGEAYLPQTISASGARYADDSESIVFWNKGDTAFIEEGGQVTFKDCMISSK